MSDRLQSTIILVVILFIACGAISFSLGKSQAAAQISKLHTKLDNATYEPLSPERLLLEINNERAKHNVAPLESSEKLNASAYLKLQDMIQSKYYAHENPVSHKKGGEYVFELTGDLCASASENLDEVHVGEDPVIGWNSSKPHYEAQINPDYSLVGFAAGRSWDGQILYVAHFCQKQ